MKVVLLTAIIIWASLCRLYAGGDSTVLDKIAHFPSRFFSKASGKISSLQSQLDKQTDKYVEKLMRREARLKKRLFKLDSNATKVLYSGNPDQTYASLLRKMKSDTTATTGIKPLSGDYYAYADSLQGSLSFLNKNPEMLSGSGATPAQVQSTLNQLKVLQSKMQDADELKQYIQQRKEQLKQYLSRYTTLPAGITNAYQDYNRQLYYYTEQVKQYKETLNDPDKMMKLALTVLNKVPAFTNFIRNNSILASAFNLSGKYNPSATGLGLSTRDQVMAAFQNQLGGASTVAGGPNPSSITQQNIGSAQGSADQLSDKLNRFGGGADIDIPDFRRNDQKTRSVLKRLQVGTSMQTVSSSYFFPATTDLGLSLGYRLDSKNILGVRAGYKMGWGRDISHISLSGQGVNIGGFTDINLKKSVYISGGFEYNYQQPLSIARLPRLKSWQQSGLIGLSKIVSLKTKFLKSSKVQVLWDFLSYQQIPRAQPIKFRIGYNF